MEQGIDRYQPTFHFERKIVCQMTTLVVASQQCECLWIPHLESP